MELEEFETQSNGPSRCNSRVSTTAHKQQTDVWIAWQ
jgi:hypothetical protein